MKEDLRTTIINWQNHNILGIKNKYVRIKNLPNGEFQIEIIMKEKINYLGESAHVIETASLITAVQSGSTQTLADQLYPNPLGDIYRFNAIAINLEATYWTKRENEMSRLIQEVMPDGFLDL